VGYEAKLISYHVVDRVLLCIADPFEQGCFTGIRSTDNEDSKVGIFCPKFCSFFRISSCRWRRVRAARSGDLGSQSKHLLQVFEKTFGLRRILISHILQAQVKEQQTSTNLKFVHRTTSRLIQHIIPTLMSYKRPSADGTTIRSIRH